MSYGNNAPQGFQPNYSSSSSTWNGQTSDYNILSTTAGSIFTGDPVTFDGLGGIKIGVTGAAVLGVFQGVIYTSSTGEQTYRPYWVGGTVLFPNSTAIASVIDDPAVEFNIQAGTSAAPPAAGSIAQTNIGDNVNFLIGTGSTSTGQSGAFLDMTTAGAGTTLNCKIVRLTAIPGNVYALAFNNAIVTFNNHILKGGTGTAGI